VRVDGAKIKLSGPQLTDWIRSREPERDLATKDATLDSNLLKLSQRVRRTLAGHGLQAGHLARFFAARGATFTITLADQQNDATFLKWLDEPKIAWIAETFGVRREWIDGEDDHIYEWCVYDKDPAQFLSTISRHADALIYQDIPANSDALFIRHGIGDEWMKRGSSRVFVIVRVPLARLSNETIVYRYLSDFLSYMWAEGRTAVQLRAWARLLAVNKHIRCVGREVPLDIGEQIEDNTVFLHEILESPKLTQRCRDDWHPEDFALYPGESAVAKPDAFFPHVIDFLLDHNLPHEPTRRVF
jgi:hypothetical protein